jgi:hypothetical protein
VVDDLLDIYHVDLNSRTCWLFPRSMPTMFVKKKKTKQGMDATSKDKAQVQTPNKTIAKKEKMPKKIVNKMNKENMEGEGKKKAKMKNEGGEEGAPQDFMCKKNDGKGWNCKERVSRPNTLCERHVRKKLSYLNPKFASPIEEEKAVVMALAVGSKPCSSSKTRKKKPTSHFNTIEDFYYYDGFGPLLGKKYCRSTTHSSASLAPKQEEVELELPKDASPLNQAKVVVGDGTSYGVATHDDVPTCDDHDNIASIDEGSCEDDYDPDSSSRNINSKRKKNVRTAQFNIILSETVGLYRKDES